MTESFTEPWRQLPTRVADVVEPELPAITSEILTTIASEVPEYARPLEGSFGAGVQTGVTEALRQFVALIRDPDAGRGTGREVYLALGRGELRQGRELDSLLAAYRLGARVAWRRASAAGQAAGLDTAVLSLLAESMFAYIDELSADSADGYAQARAELEGERQRRRRDLIGLLMSDPPAPEGEQRAAAALAGWEMPVTIAPLACAEADLPAVMRELPGGEVLASTREGHGCVLLPDPSGPGRAETWGRAVARAAESVAIGPVVTVAGAPSGPEKSAMRLSRSWRLAVLARKLDRAGRPIMADEHLAELILLESGDLAERIAVQRLSALTGLTAAARLRLEETARQYARHGGNAAAVAASLGIHPQTARHRIARLRELYGEELDDPRARFELELALRARELQGLSR